jgi:hypothetical protein
MPDVRDDLARFALRVLEQFHNHGERGEIDCDWLQETAQEIGLLGDLIRMTPCSENCVCEEFVGAGEMSRCAPIRDDVFALMTESITWTTHFVDLESRFPAVGHGDDFMDVVLTEAQEEEYNLSLVKEERVETLAAALQKIADGEVETRYARDDYQRALNHIDGVQEFARKALGGSLD